MHGCDLIWNRCSIAVALLMLSNVSFAEILAPDTSTSISSNPAAVYSATGNGVLQSYIEKQLGIKNNHGISFGGVWLGDVNQLFSGGIDHPDRTTLNSSLLLDISADTQKLAGWPGGGFGVQLLQLNAQSTNEQSGIVQGYNSVPGPLPLNRFELYQLWFRQELFDKKLIFRIGKTVPTYDFNNVVKPVALDNANVFIPSVSGLIYTPIFVNSSMLGVIPGYYNSAYGINLSFAPIKTWYVSYGIYDGNLARGEQLGLHATPTFNGAYYQIAETGLAWLLGQEGKPGTFAVGAWHQDGEIKSPPTVTENSASGFYLFGSQRVWYRDPNVDSSGYSLFYQYGVNNSRALPVRKYIGAGLTAFGLIGNRVDDSLGIGAAFAWLNPNIFNHSNELLIQTYYQAQIFKELYLEPVITYSPSPGVNGTKNNAWAGTLRAILIF